MLLRMYTRWAEKHGFKVEYLEETAGRRGRHQVGDHPDLRPQRLWLAEDRGRRAPAGAHLAVRFQRAPAHLVLVGLRSFRSIDDSIKIDIKESDVRTDTMRSGGAGGQHVNKTESAVRLTHIPTGVAVVCQAGRSQHKNRAQAWDMLRARLYEIELKKREEQAAADQAAKTDIGWGHQIRSYVLQPYQMVKDLRTGVQTSDTQGVLDGDLDEFMAATLAQRAFGTTPRARSRMWIDERVAFIGLGRMGHGMAGRYLDAGFTVAVWNRSKAKAEDLIARGARWATSPEDAAIAPTRSSPWSPTTRRRARSGSARMARPRRLRPGRSRSNAPRSPITRAGPGARAAQRAGLIYIDCPVTGLPDAAASGKLTLLVGADAADLEKARPFLAPLGTTIRHFGASAPARSTS